MKVISVGIVRRIDDLGRIVIPKEMRKELGYNEGDSFEIFKTEDGGVYLRKHDIELDLKKEGI